MNPQAALSTAARRLPGSPPRRGDAPGRPPGRHSPIPEPGDPYEALKQQIPKIRQQLTGLKQQVAQQWDTLLKDEDVQALKKLDDKYAVLQKSLGDGLQAAAQRPGELKEGWLLLGNIISASGDVAAALHYVAIHKLDDLLIDKTSQKMSELLPRFFTAYEECMCCVESIQQKLSGAIEAYAKAGDTMASTNKRWFNAELRQCVLRQAQSAVQILGVLVVSSRGVVKDESGAFKKEPDAFHERLSCFLNDMDEFWEAPDSKGQPLVVAAVLQRAEKVCCDLHAETVALGAAFERVTDEYAFRPHLERVTEAVRSNLELAASTIEEDASEHALLGAREDQPSRDAALRQARVLMEQRYKTLAGPGFYPQWSAEELAEAVRGAPAAQGAAGATKGGGQPAAKPNSPSAAGTKAALAKARRQEAEHWVKAAQQFGQAFADGVPKSVEEHQQVANARLDLLQAQLRDAALERVPSQDWLDRLMKEIASGLDEKAQQLLSSLRGLRPLRDLVPIASPAGGASLRKQLRKTEGVLCDGLGQLQASMQLLRERHEVLSLARTAKSFLAGDMRLTDNYVGPLTQAGLMTVQPHGGARLPDAWGYFEEREACLRLPPDILKALGGDSLLRRAQGLHEAPAKTLFDDGKDKVIRLAAHNHFSAPTGGDTTAMHTKLWHQRRFAREDASGQPVIRARILFTYTMQQSLQALRRAARESES